MSIGYEYLIIYDNMAEGHGMVWFDYLWLEGEDGNIEHVTENGLGIEDVEYVIENFAKEETSRSSGRPMRFGYTADGRFIAVVFDWLDDVTIYPITAYEVED